MGYGRILVVAGEDTFSHKAILCLAEAGFTTTVISPYRLSALRLSRHVDAVERIPWTDFDHPGPRLAEQINAIARTHGCELIFPVDEAVIRAILVVQDDLVTPIMAMPSSHAFETCDDKAVFARFCDAEGIPQPSRWVALDSAADLEGLTIDEPTIVKPSHGGGGVGVAVVSSMQELRDHIASGKRGTHYPLLLQEMIPGEDVDCSFYAEGGEIIASAVQTRQSMSDPNLRFIERPDVEEVCAELARRLRYDGLAHVDLRHDERDGSVRVIEVNPRVWGSVAYAMWGGINFPAIAVRRALGRPVDPDQHIEPGLVVNPGVTANMLVRSWTGRGAPSDLIENQRTAWSTNAGDPLPYVAVKGRVIAKRLRGLAAVGKRP